MGLLHLSYLPFVWGGGQDPGTGRAGTRKNGIQENAFLKVSGICCVAPHPYLFFFKYESRSESGYSVRDTITNAMSDTSDIVVVAPLLNSEEKVPKLR